MRALFGSLTTRGRCLLAAGVAAALCGLAIPETDLVRVGVLLILLPLVSALIARRSRYRLSCSRRLSPARVPAGESSEVTARLENVSRLRTSVLLAEDLTPYTLGSRPRFVLDQLEPGGHRDLSYQVRPQTRGRYTIGPLRIRIADGFGLVEITRSFSTSSTLMVTPKIHPLPRAAAPSSWLGEGDGGTRTIASSGEDDAAPREYQDGDSLHRVHWRSTARYGELMVRREEHQWRNSASIFLDTRRSAHRGTGPAGTFELAVSAAASIGAHLAEEGFRAALITEAGEIAPQGSFQDTLLDLLAVITPSRERGLRSGASALAHAGGQLIAVVGELDGEDARQLAASRRGNAPAMALMLGGTAALETTAAEILTAAGWRVAPAGTGLPLADAWQQLHRPQDPVVPGRAPVSEGAGP